MRASDGGVGGRVMVACQSCEKVFELREGGSVVRDKTNKCFVLARCPKCGAGSYVPASPRKG